MIDISGNDWLGLGAAISGVAASKVHPDCGKRPTCLLGANCKQRKEEYARCIASDTSQKNAVDMTNAQAGLINAGNMKYLYIGIIAAVVLLVLILILKR